MVVAIATCAAFAWMFWPARTLAKPTYPVVAAQGDIQNVKWTPELFQVALDRYERVTEQAATYNPAFVLWPEASMPANLNALPLLQLRLSRLARSTHTELIVGAQQMRAGKVYNALYFFRSDGSLDAVYRKRILVPFAEMLPFTNIFGMVPGAALVSSFSARDANGGIDVVGMR